MKKKALVLALMFLIIPILTAIPAYGGKGTNVVSFKFTFEDQRYFLLGPPTPTGQTMHLFMGYDLGEDGVVHLVIDGDDYYSYGTSYAEDSDFTYYSEMYIESHKFSDPDTGFGNLHWWYTLDFGGDDVISMKCNGKNYQTDPDTSWGNLVGFGTG